MMRKFVAGLILFLATASSAQADPVVYFTPEGNAYAVTGLNVNGQIVNATFAFGSYADVFGNSPPIGWQFGIATLIAVTEALAEALNGPPQAVTVGPIGGPYEGFMAFTALPPFDDGLVGGALLCGGLFNDGPHWINCGLFGWDVGFTEAWVWTIFAVPEPAPFALLLVGLVVLASVLRRRIR